MANNTGTESMVTVWVTEHDDPTVGYVVNTLEEMSTNYDDLADQGWAMEPFEDYLDTWTTVEIPQSVLDGDATVRALWLDIALSAR